METQNPRIGVQINEKFIVRHELASENRTLFHPEKYFFCSRVVAFTKVVNKQRKQLRSIYSL